MTDGFKGLHLVDRMPEELWMEVHNIVQETEPNPREKNKKHKEMQEGIVVVWGDFTNC